MVLVRVPFYQGLRQGQQIYNSILTRCHNRITIIMTLSQNGRQTTVRYLLWRPEETAAGSLDPASVFPDDKIKQITVERPALVKGDIFYFEAQSETGCKIVIRTVSYSL